MNRKMPKGKPPKVFQGVHARLVFLKKEDERAVLDLMRGFSSATRYAYNRLLEGQDRKELIREDSPLCRLFSLNTRYADGAIEKAQAALDSAKEPGQDPRKVVFGSRKLFEQLKRKHLSGKALLALKRERKERRQGLLYSRGDAAKKGNANLRLEPRDGALWLRVNLGDGAYAQALVKTAHPQREALLQRVHASLPYNVTLQLKDGKVYAHFTWSEGLPPPVHTEANGVLGVDVNADPYHLALAVVSPDGNLVRRLTLSLREVDSAPNRGAKELLLWKVAHQVVAAAEEHGVAVATERLKHLRKSKRGDGSGRAFRHKQHRFAYRSLLEKIHALARKRGVEVLEVSPQDTSTIGMLKYAPQLHLSKDVAAAYVVGRRALGFEEKLPKGYKALLRNESFFACTEGFYGSRLQELQKLKEGGEEPPPQAEAFPGDGEGPPSAFPPFELSWPKRPESEPSGLAGKPEGGNRRKEPLRRQSLASPEGRHFPSPSRARGAQRPLSPQAHPALHFAIPGIVGGVEVGLRSSSWCRAGGH
jgi:IS605 OrfB family transposase